MKFKSYNSCVEYLFSLERAGIKYDLHNIKALSSLDGDPHKRFRAIHIAGTNGKGSTASIISSILTESNKRTGLYTSPHIKDFRERIMIDGIMIPKPYVIEYTEKHYNEIEQIKPSFFEVTTAMAFKYFADNDVDFAVVECGLGGRLDSTNIINPIVSVITSISIDHTEYLGNTIKSITLEKAGIIKPNVPCVTGRLSNYTKGIIRNVCRKEDSPHLDSMLLKVEKMTKCINGYEIIFEISGEKLFLPLMGDYQVDNLKTALFALFYLVNNGYVRTDYSKIETGLFKIAENTGYKYRFQKVWDNPKIILDVSHNAEGIGKLRESLSGMQYKRLFIIFGMMSDKEIRKCIYELEKLNGFIILTKPDYKRAGDPFKFAKYISDSNKYVIRNNVKESYIYAMANSKKGDLILITGSFFMVSDFLKFYKGK